MAMLDNAKQNQRRACRILGLALVATLLAGVGEGTAAPVQAIPAHEVVNRLGVQTHFGWQGTIYGLRSRDVKVLLGELGVRYIRDALGNSTANQFYAELRRDLGIRILAVADARKLSGDKRIPAPENLESMIKGAKANIGGEAILGFEGLNEANQLQAQDGILGWPEMLRVYMEQLKKAVNGAGLGHLPILAPAMAEPANTKWYDLAGNYSDLSDLGNGHIYGTYLSFSQKLDEVLPIIDRMNPGKPVWASEFGWQTAANSGGLWIDEGSKVKYLSRAILELGVRRKTVQRGFIYQLVDHMVDPGQLDRRAHFGLIDYQLKRKPSFYAVRNMMHILCDDALSRTPGTLDLRLQGDTRNVRTLLMQKRNGAYYLAVWLEVQSVRRTGTVVVRPQRLSISFGQRMQQVQVFRPADPTSDLTQGRTPRYPRYTSTSSVSVDVLDHPLILELVPRGVATPGPITSCTFRGT